MRRALLAALVLLLGIPAARADYPDRPIKLVVGYAPGGPADALARIISQKMSELLGQPVVIENRGGASGNIAGAMVAKSAPDGYTLLFAGSTLVVNITLFKNPGYDPIKDFTPVSQLVRYMLVLVAHPSLGVNSVAELVALAKAKPGSIDYASAGSGSGTHLAAEFFKQRAGIDMVHIPYKEAAGATNDLIAGQVKLMFNNPFSALPQVRSGRLKALAVTGTQRLANAPDLPTIAELGYPGYEAGTWYGLIGPAGMPAEAVARLYEAVKGTLSHQGVRDQLALQGADPIGNSPTEAAASMLAERDRWAKVIVAAGIKQD